MALRVEHFTGRGDERRESDAAGSIAAGILKLRELLDYTRLAGAQSALIQT